MLADGEAPAVLPGLAADRRAGLLADTGTASETAARSLALLSSMVDDGEPEQLDGGDVVREVAACLGDFPELVVQGVEGGAILGLRASGRHEQAGAWTGAPADVLARVILSILPGFLLNLALLGPRGVAGFPDAVRTLWPS